MALAAQFQLVGEDGNAAKVNSSGALEVDATLTPSGTQDVNLTQVAGAAVTAGAGAVAAGTQRTTLASNDPAVVALQIIDDWDETDRAKVNPIVGQAGIAAGAGAVDATTVRTTSASDDPLVTKSASLAKVTAVLTSIAVNSQATNVTIIASNAARVGLILNNTDANDLYIKYGATATVADFTVRIPTGGYWEMPQPIYTGIIDGIWSADGSGAAIGSQL